MVGEYNINQILHLLYYLQSSWESQFVTGLSSEAKSSSVGRRDGFPVLSKEVLKAECSFLVYFKLFLHTDFKKGYELYITQWDRPWVVC